MTSCDQNLQVSTFGRLTLRERQVARNSGASGVADGFDMGGWSAWQFCHNSSNWRFKLYLESPFGLVSTPGFASLICELHWILSLRLA
jgi:hypothetical protein